ncbi:hypothetical protein P5673_018726 [Acropora cervicornis]|uniref:Uncharacterized protein n=1 Tax=Acropora cervicornis TaxID=6130 RepID=A0AAD9V2S6_ACRCE|nr:hypothetical protein P5673_018726 [Acropora cervicornis]
MDSFMKEMDKCQSCHEGKHITQANKFLKSSKFSFKSSKERSEPSQSCDINSRTIEICIIFFSKDLRRSRVSHENSDESPLSSSPEYEIEHGSDGVFASPSATEDEDAAAAFPEEPLADAEWTAQYERERKDNKELEKQLKDRLEGTVAVSKW